ncbi:MAG TPA: HEAT repeat domain-containing protein [Bryobacteraceae bacterium]|jgi:HEAT repeat protein
MDLKQILELLGQEHVPGDEMTGAFLEDAVASFALNPAGATNSIRQLQASDPPGFVLAAVRLLTQTEEKSPGVQYVAGLMFQGNLLIDALLDKRILAHDAATALARNLATAEPLLDVRLVRKMLANAAGDIRAVKAEAAMRVLSLVDAISDCSRLSSYLVQLMRHPSALVRSKVGLLLGRSNLNLNRIKSFMASDDARLRANAVESMWGLKDRSVVTILWDATKDSHRRVVINALVGLCRAGEREAFERLVEMGGSSEAMIRAGVAWAMGEIGAPEFADPLQKLSSDKEPNVRSMAGKSLNKLPVAVAEISA